MRVLWRDIRAGKRKAAILDLESIARKEIERALDQKVKKHLIREHEEVVESWKNQPGFAARKYLRRDHIKVAVYPTCPHKDIWEYVDQGTRPHTITGSPRLTFKWGGKGSYVPKTRPYPRASVVKGGGYVRNATWRGPYSVQHPGTEARQFSKQIAGDYLQRFRREMENAFRRAARRVQE